MRKFLVGMTFIVLASLAAKTSTLAAISLAVAGIPLVAVSLLVLLFSSLSRMGLVPQSILKILARKTDISPITRVAAIEKLRNEKVHRALAKDKTEVWAVRVAAARQLNDLGLLAEIEEETHQSQMKFTQKYLYMH